MRSPSLAWLAAVLPLLVACGADAGSGGDGEEEGGRPVAGERGLGANPGGDGTTPSGPGTNPPGSGPAAGACSAQPACDAAGGPQLGAKRPWIHSLVSPAVVASGPAFHRGRDQIVAAGDAQWVLGKFTYSYIDTDLDDEEVDVFLDRGCGGAWEKLGTTKTTTAGSHSTVEGVEDDGGRVYFQIPAEKKLAPGRHRVRMVVAGDQTSADAIIDVVAKGSPIVVSDVDGTLTDSETAEYPALLSGALPNAQPKAADALSALAVKGYHPVYLTARPEWLTGRTKEFLAKNGFPPGVVRTTTGITGAIGGAAASFKSAELSLLAGHGHKLEWAFGNQTSDADAYDAAQINPKDHRVLLRVNDPHGGRRIEAYSEIIPSLQTLPATCN
jgi:hypothetical protein